MTLAKHMNQTHTNAKLLTVIQWPFGMASQSASQHKTRLHSRIRTVILMQGRDDVSKTNRLGMHWHQYSCFQVAATAAAGAHKHSFSVSWCQRRNITGTALKHGAMQGVNLDQAVWQSGSGWLEHWGRLAWSSPGPSRYAFVLKS